MKRELLYFTSFLLICLTLPLPATAQVVSIPDSSLRTTIETALGKTSGDTITVADMARLTHLEARNTNISDLTGLEHATNLTNLLLGETHVEGVGWINSNSVSDLSPLSGLTNLTGLWLERNAFTDISPLAGLTNLTELNLGGNNLSNISPVAGLTNLRQLWLWDNNISDISPVAGLTNLIELILQSNAISDISPVAGLTNLTGLWLAYNNISDISPLVANTGLGSGDRVFVNGNPLSFVSIKTHVPALQSRGVTVESDDRTPTTLLLISGVITDLNNVLIVEVRDSKGLPFEGVPVIFTVTSGGGTLSVTRTTTDENGRAESRLTLRSSGGTNTVRASVEGLSESVAFSDVALDIPDLNLRAAIENALGVPPGTPIAPQTMAALTRLEARNANISDLTGLEYATNLKHLWLSGNNISAVSVLTNLTNLKSLDLAGNPISDTLPLTGLTQLARLDLSQTSISDISPLAGLTNLKTLRLKHNSISDLSPLVANTGLGSGDEVYVQGNPLGYVSIHTHIPVLQTRGVTVDEDTTHLNTGEPRTVRLIYFLPNDRPYRADVVQRLKDGIRNVQTFYAEQMSAHGYGNKTFRVETDSKGDPIVHRVDGQYPDNHYFDHTVNNVQTEIDLVFNRYANIYLIVIDTINTIGGSATTRGKNAGTALVYGEFFHGEFGWGPASHELGHAFGLWHDFRDGTYLMSYGPGSQDQLSACHAEYLSVHPYFNPDTPIEEGPPPTIELISPRTYPADSKSIPVRLKVSDSDGLHQVLLHLGPPNIINSRTVKACRGLEGKKEAVIEFDYDGVIPSAHEPSYSINTSLLNPLVHPIHAEAVDINGNVGEEVFFLFSETLQPLSKISGDNQTGLPNTPLRVPFVIEVRDVNSGRAQRGVSITFTVIAGGGLLSTTRTTTDENGRTESRLTLGSNLGTTTVEVSATGIEGTVTFSAVADPAVAGAAVNIPDANLRTAVETTLGKAKGDPIAPAEMATLINFRPVNRYISDLTGLEHATNLKSLHLGGHSIVDISPVAGLTNLTELFLWVNSIADISAVEGLTNLTKLHLGGNSITDISPVAGLTNLTELLLQDNNISDISPLVANTGLGKGDTVDARGNPLSYQSIHTHILILRERGVEIAFDNQAHPALLKISGDNQKGASNAPLLQPFVIEVQDENGSAPAGVSVTFAVTTGDSTLSVTSTITDENGRAQSTFTLGPNLGTNTVEVSAAGIQGKVTFRAISDTESPPITADVNNDGSVNILDLILIASELGNVGTNLAADVNRDGVVGILDLVLAAGMFDGTAAAPAALPQVPETLTAVEVQGWLTDARALEVRDPTVKRGFVVLEQLLVSLTPRETELLPNYPNPFNPETWIPYRLAEDAFVTLTIYDLNGRAIRTLDVGHRIASAYENRSKAIYWDGRNGLGERVASGVYFYTLTAEDYSATRKMLILK